MRPIFLGFVIALLSFHASAYACSMLNPEKTQIGSRPAIRGLCSNNGLRVTCHLIEGFGIECDGPSGGYTGYDLGDLIFSACGCSTEEERELQLERQLRGDKPQQ